MGERKQWKKIKRQQKRTVRQIKPRKLHLNKPISHEATNIVKKNYNYYDKKNTNKEIIWNKTTEEESSTENSPSTPETE